MKAKTKETVLQTLKYFAFAASAGAIQITSFTLLTEFSGLSHWPCYLISLVLSVLWNFTFNRKFTFKSSSNIAKAMLLVVAYYCVFTPLSTLWNKAITEANDAHWMKYTVEVGTMLLNGVTEFLWYRFVVFRRSMNTAEKKQKDR